MSDQPIGGRTTAWDALIGNLKDDLIRGVEDHKTEKDIVWAITTLEQQLGRESGLSPQGWAEWKYAYDAAKRYNETIGRKDFSPLERDIIEAWKEEEIE